MSKQLQAEVSRLSKVVDGLVAELSEIKKQMSKTEGENGKRPAKANRRR